jgi:hypothetical protein
MNTSLQKKLG